MLAVAKHEELAVLVEQVLANLIEGRCVILSSRLYMMSYSTAQTRAGTTASCMFGKRATVIGFQTLADKIETHCNCCCMCRMLDKKGIKCFLSQALPVNASSCTDLQELLTPEWPWALQGALGRSDAATPW